MKRALCHCAMAGLPCLPCNMPSLQCPLLAHRPSAHSPIAYRPWPMAHRLSCIAHRPWPIAHGPSPIAHRPSPTPCLPCNIPCLPCNIPCLQCQCHTCPAICHACLTNMPALPRGRKVVGGMGGLARVSAGLGGFMRIWALELGEERPNDPKEAFPVLKLCYNTAQSSQQHPKRGISSTEVVRCFERR